MKYLIILGLLASPLTTWASYSMKRCTLLPVTDGVGGSVANVVFSDVEKIIKDGQYCDYSSNADLLHIFSRYRNNLGTHLKTGEVLKVVAEKLKVGSLIRVNIKNEINGVEVEMEVHGEDGSDSYFYEKKSIASNDVQEISYQVREWLKEYKKTIPYDAMVLGVLGEQINIDLPKDVVVVKGQEFFVKKLTEKKKHPLLKRVVEWNTDIVAQGEVANISTNQALGEIKHYKNNGRVSSGDWVTFNPVKEKKFDVSELKKIEPGKLGSLSAAFSLSSLDASNKTRAGNNSASGPQVGVDLNLEAWITRMYFASISYGKSVGSITRDQGDVDSHQSTDLTKFKLVGGYRYLPLGFFYGPQVDFYTGFGSYTYDLSDAAEHGFSEHSFKGLLVGVKGNMPMNNLYRIYAGFELMAFPSFSDSSDFYSDKKSISSIELEFGVKYQYNPRMTFDAGYQFSNRKAGFHGDFKEINYLENKLKLGASLTF